MTFEEIIQRKIKEQEQKIEDDNKAKNYLEANISRIVIKTLEDILNEAKG